MLRGIRTRLLGLVVATVVPFTALVGGGLWNQWQSDQAQAIKSALVEARLLAAQLDDQINEFENLLVGLSAGLSTDPNDIAKNDAMLRQTKEALPDYIGSLLLSSPDGKNLGTSFHPAESGRTYIGDRDYFGWLVVNPRLEIAVGDPVHGRTTGNWVTSIARGIKAPDGRLAAVSGSASRSSIFKMPSGCMIFPPVASCRSSMREASSSFVASTAATGSDAG